MLHCTCRKEGKGDVRCSASVSVCSLVNISGKSNYKGENTHTYHLCLWVQIWKIKLDIIDIALLIIFPRTFKFVVSSSDFSQSAFTFDDIEGVKPSTTGLLGLEACKAEPYISKISRLSLILFVE